MLEDILKKKVEKYLDEFSRKGYLDPYEDIIITNCEIFLSGPSEYQMGVVYLLKRPEIIEDERKSYNTINVKDIINMRWAKRVFEIDESILNTLGPFLIENCGVRMTVTSSSKLLNLSLKNQTIKRVYIDFLSNDVSISLDMDLKNL